MEAPVRSLPPLPIELWRCILRLSTVESDHEFFQANSVSFGWPYKATFDAPFFRSLATKWSLVLVSRQFSEMALEFLYETLHFRRPGQAVALAEQCRESLKVPGHLNSWTKTLYITPIFNLVVSEQEIEEMDAVLQSLLTITQACTRLRNALVRVDTVTLFHGPTYQPWVQILGALPSGLRRLTMENFLLGPVVWKPRLFSGWNASSELRTLQLDAEHPPFEHHFPFLTHLWLFTWATASKWEMPSLRNLYIEYFPGNDSTSGFWTVARPQLRHLHFGGDTDFGLYYPDLPQRLRTRVPNLKILEYHYAGDLDILWDPAQLPQSLEHVAIRLHDTESHGISHALSPQDVLLQYTAEFGTLIELLTDLCPSGADRRLRIGHHLEKYSLNSVKLYALLPAHVASLVQPNDPSPLIQFSRATMLSDGPR